MLQLDTDILLFLNGLHTPFGDSFMWNYSQKLTWIPLYFVLVGYIIFRWRKQSIWILLAFALCIGLADFVSSSIIKPLIERPRPTRVPELEGLLHLVNDYRSGRFGFVSSHAANSFALATLFTLISKDKWAAFMLFSWAMINAYSRIYLGVHYPGDILGGTIVGIAIAFCCYFLLKKVRPQSLQPIQENSYFLKIGVFAIWLLSLFVLALLGVCMIMF